MTKKDPNARHYGTDRTKWLQVRVTEKWKKRLALAAKQSDRTISDFVHDVLEPHLPQLPEEDDTD